MLAADTSPSPTKFNLDLIQWSSGPPVLPLPFPHKGTIPVYGPRRHGAWPRGEEYPQARETCYPIPMPLPDQTHSLLFVFQSPSPMPCSVLMMLCLNILLLTFFALLFCCFTSSSAAQWDHIKLRHPGCVPPPPRGLTPSCMRGSSTYSHVCATLPMPAGRQVHG